MNAHLGYRPGEAKPAEQADERNGVSAKTLLTKRGSVRVQLPRDRDGSFEPVSASFSIQNMNVISPGSMSASSPSTPAA